MPELAPISKAELRRLTEPDYEEKTVVWSLKESLRERERTSWAWTHPPSQIYESVNNQRMRLAEYMRKQKESA